MVKVEHRPETQLTTYILYVVIADELSLVFRRKLPVLWRYNILFALFPMAEFFRQAKAD